MLEGDRVVLRPIQAWDRERLYELVETIEVRALSDNEPPLPVSLEEVEARDKRWIEEHHTDSAWFAIDVDAETIGMCGLHSIDHLHQRADVGIRIGKPLETRPRTGRRSNARRVRLLPAEPRQDLAPMPGR